MLTFLQTKGMTLEDISVLFGDPVELSFEQALSHEQSSKVDDFHLSKEHRLDEEIKTFAQHDHEHLEVQTSE